MRPLQTRKTRSSSHAISIAGARQRFLGLTRSRTDEEKALHVTDEELARSQRALLRVIAHPRTTRTSKITPIKPQSSEWYLAYLKDRWLQLPNAQKRLVRNMVDAPEDFHSPVYYEILTIIATSLTDTKKPSLQSIVETLCDARLLVEGVENDDDAYQLAFMAIGWLTFLYDSSISSKHRISVRSPSEEDGQSYFQTTSNSSAPLSEMIDIPIHQVLKYFGQLIPGSIEATFKKYQPDVFSEQLILGYLNFQTLYRVAEIRLEFVDLLSQHLKFEERTKTLKIFRFPSICEVVASHVLDDDHVQAAGGRQEYLHQLFSSYFAGQIDEEDFENYSAPEQLRPSDLFREVLLSYRLIFGQDPKSWKLFKEKYAASVSKLQDDAGNPDHPDPLLLRLCGSDGRLDAEFYSKVNVPLPKSQYSTKTDFRFLGQRLVALQKYVLDQNPSDLRTLWHDRRDVLRFYTFWAVVVVGGLSLLLSLIQNILGIIALVVA